jgi:hypothetical protein
VREVREVEEVREEEPQATRQINSNKDQAASNKEKRIRDSGIGLMNTQYPISNS